MFSADEYIRNRVENAPDGVAYWFAGTQAALLESDSDFDHREFYEEVVVPAENNRGYNDDVLQDALDADAVRDMSAPEISKLAGNYHKDLRNIEQTVALAEEIDTDVVLVPLRGGYRPGAIVTSATGADTAMIEGSSRKEIEEPVYGQETLDGAKILIPDDVTNTRKTFQNLGKIMYDVYDAESVHGIAFSDTVKDRHHEIDGDGPTAVEVKQGAPSPGEHENLVSKVKDDNIYVEEDLDDLAEFLESSGVR